MPHVERSRTRRAAAFVVIAGLVATIAACGKGTQDSGATGSGPATPSKELSLLFPVSNPGLKETLAAVLGQDFTARTGITVDVQTGANSYSEVDQRLFADIATGRPPDMAIVSYSSVKTYADSGVAKPLDTALANAQFPTDHIYDQFLALGQHEGKTVAVPQSITLLNLWYNADAFRRAGLDPDKPPTTYEQLRSASEKIVKSGAAKVGVAWRSADSTASWPFQNFVASYGGSLATPDGAPDFQNANALSALTYWSDMQKDGLAVGSTGAVVEQQFLSGEAAMTANTSSYLPILSKGAKFDLRLSALPGATAQAPRLIPQGGFMISTNPDPHKLAAAVEVMKVLASGPGQVEQARLSGYLPVNESEAQSGELATVLATDPRRQVTLDWPQYVTPMQQLRGRNAQEAWSKLDLAVGQAIAGKSSPADALREAQTQAARVIK
ncbi:extracellular solute-binding protein [Phytohabitans sp. ZYX-F-186]|uniref:Extracellular solute-binding protein n=1 Tax=Phytohabitans maris TaxID=3071409 RepID=A0ABU0ZP70_9ACTN|nr:extracellular solute-binding protein [Phytohabitans sp. ZYX-F-186]MDQ7908753.1 extracellular solute-binding protein [Phytohabitans sp. ZYX-F-186]